MNYLDGLLTFRIKESASNVPPIMIAKIRILAKGSHIINPPKVPKTAPKY